MITIFFRDIHESMVMAAARVLHQHSPRKAIRCGHSSHTGPSARGLLGLTVVNVGTVVPNDLHEIICNNLKSTATSLIN